MAAGKMNIVIDPESTSAELVLNVGGVTLGIKSREDMPASLRIEQNTSILRAVCALLNSRGGVVKGYIENKDYSLTRHGIGEDLDTSLKAILPLIQHHLDFKQKGCYFLISVKSRSLDICRLHPTTIATNLYMRNGASCVKMDLGTALQFFQDIENPGVRSPVKTRLLDERPGENMEEDLHVQGRLNVQEDLHVQRRLDVQEDLHVQKLAAAFFDQTEVTKMAEFSFGESKNVEYKSFETNKLVQRVKEVLPRIVSAFANTDGGYFFIGLDEKSKRVAGFKADENKLMELKREIEECIQRLPVTHFCEEKQGIKYMCKFIRVRKSEAVYSYVCALRVERFCCAVFAEEPESWHVDNSCVKRFTTEQWVKVLMASMPVAGREISH